MLKLPNSIEPAVMAENIVHLRDAESSLNGRVSDLETTAPKDYSTTETATGKKWIDGKEIYSKVFTFTTPAEAGSYTVGTINDLSTLIDIEIIMTNSGTGSQNKQVPNVYGVTSGGVISYVVPSAFVECKGFANVLYTKSVPGRAPEDSDQEPEEKKTTKKKTTK